MLTATAPAVVSSSVDAGSTVPSGHSTATAPSGPVFPVQEPMGAAAVANILAVCPVPWARCFARPART